MKTPNGKYSYKNGYLQIVIHRGRASACGEKFTVMTACNTFGKRPCGWSAQKPCVIRPTVCLDVTSLAANTYGCDSGRIGPTRCALIDAVLGDRWRTHQAS